MVWLGAWLALPSLPGAELILFNPPSADRLGEVEPNDAQVTRVDQGLRVRTGHANPWPGVTLRPLGPAWDCSQCERLEVTIRNRSERELTLYCRVDNPGADGKDHCLTDHAVIAPGQVGTVAVRLQATPWALSSPLELIGMRGYPQYPEKLNPRNIVALVAFLHQPTADADFEISRIIASGDVQVLPSDRFIPFIDEYGQFIHADWPGKVRRAGDLQECRRREAADHETHPGPVAWNQYGGWTAGPQLQATGFFRVQKYQGQWWLVDPEGRLFWSHGIDCVHDNSSTPITDRERYWRWLPDDDSPFAAFYGTGSWAPHGYYRDHLPYRTYDFSRANLLRKYGENWPAAIASITHRRLRSWGLNTIGNWSQADLCLLRRTPYVGTLHFEARTLEASTGYWGKFYDVFDPGFREGMRRVVAAQAGKSIQDPWCIGFFVHNELAWGDDLSLALATLKCPPDQPAKQVFQTQLKDTYKTVARLNEAWGSAYSSWDDFLTSIAEPDHEKAADDLGRFYQSIAETYFATIREELKRAAPNQLYLGCRFAWVNDRAARAAAEYCDVVGYNCYAYSVADLRLPGGLDMPIIIGEFHFGALDRGMFHTGLKPTLSQDDRAAKYQSYLRGALRNPNIVGAHWFQYRDQATTGRGDGENYQIGFVDICDTPYPETIAASREIGAALYTTRLEH